MDIERYTSPFECDEVISLWANIFGDYEAELERVQCDGSETEFNTDIVYLAKENGKLLGAVHTTVSKLNPEFAGMSGVCTVSEARGKGISRILFEKAMEEIDSMGVKATFLGTGNPYAVKVYESCGFSFIFCTGAMARIPGSNFTLFCNEYYGDKALKEITVVPGNGRLRLPLVPLVHSTAGDILIDINAQIVSRGIVFSQVSCMGLYQKYVDVKNAGGNFWGIVDEKGTLGGMVSIMPTERGVRADFHAKPRFKDVLPKLFEEIEKEFGVVYLQIADSDKYKIELAEKLGFKEKDSVLFPYRDTCLIPTRIYEK